MTSAPLEQKVRQLDNDVQALYELIHKVSTTQVRHTNRLTEISEDVVAIGAHLDRLESAVAGHDGRFDAHDKRFDAHDQRFDALDAKLDKVLELLGEH